MLNPAVLVLGHPFLKARPGKEARVDDLGDEAFLLLRPLVTCSGWRAHDVISYNVLACPGRNRLAALEVCPDWKGENISLSRKSLVFL